MKYAGFAKTEITPQPGTFGSLRLSPAKRSTGIHDPLYIRAMSIREYMTRCLIITADIPMLTADNVLAVKKKIRNTHDIAGSNILIAATHTHQGPETLGEEPEIDNTPVISELIQKAADTADAAIGNEKKVMTGWGSCLIPEAAKNRYYHRLGKNSGPADAGCNFLRIEDENGRLTGVLWHFAAHPTTCMRADFITSGDYPGLVNTLIEKARGGTAIFLNGACGNINPILGKRSFDACTRTADLIFSRIDKSLKIQCTPEPLQLKTASENIFIPWTDTTPDTAGLPSREEIRSYFRNLPDNPPAPENYRDSWDRYQKYRTAWWRWKLLDLQQTVRGEHIILQVVQMGDRYLAAVPGELFAELQLDLAERCTGTVPLVCGYAGGYIGYVPNAESFENVTYETSPTYMHRVAKGGGEKIINTLASLVAELGNRERAAL